MNALRTSISRERRNVARFKIHNDRFILRQLGRRFVA